MTSWRYFPNNVTSTITMLWCHFQDYDVTSIPLKTSHVSVYKHAQLQIWGGAREVRPPPRSNFFWFSFSSSCLKKVAKITVLCPDRFGLAPPLQKILALPPSDIAPVRWWLCSPHKISGEPSTTWAHTGKLSTVLLKLKLWDSWALVVKVVA